MSWRLRRRLAVGSRVGLLVFPAFCFALSAHAQEQGQAQARAQPYEQAQGQVPAPAPAQARAQTDTQVLVQAQEFVPEPPGYRLDNYRAPVPATLQGAQALTTAQAEALWRAGASAFIDVLPRPPKPPNLPSGTIWRDAPRPHIPRSLWLPDTGYGELAEVTEDYFKRGLQRASNGDHARRLVFYCQADCWMSWNAAKRAMTYGYSNVAWYPEGTDGWRRAGLPMEEARPEQRVGE